MDLQTCSEHQASNNVPRAAWRCGHKVSCIIVSLALVSAGTGIALFCIMRLGPGDQAGQPRPFDGNFHCDSNLKIDGEVMMSKKGMCLDDTTWTGCSGKMLATWPHTENPVKIMRMFKPCAPGRCDQISRNIDWQNLLEFVQSNNVTLLMGTEVRPCDSKWSDNEWQLTLELLQKLGRQHVYAVAIGNELDLWKTDENPCLPSFWEHGYVELLKQRAADLDRIGFSDVKITAVTALSVLAPFVDTSVFQPFVQPFASFYEGAYKTFGKERWAWSFNVYPFWNAGDCSSYDTNVSLRFKELPGTLKALRKAITNITGNNDDTLWMTETGWNSGAAAGSSLSLCPKEHYSSPENMARYYERFLQWDLTLDDGYTPPDLAFYFTMRDARDESFGLLQDCDSTSCKLQQNSADSTFELLV